MELVVVTSRQHVIQDVTLDWLDRHYGGLFQVRRRGEVGKNRGGREGREGREVRGLRARRGRRAKRKDMHEKAHLGKACAAGWSGQTERRRAALGARRVGCHIGATRAHTAVLPELMARSSRPALLL